MLTSKACGKVGQLLNDTKELDLHSGQPQESHLMVHTCNMLPLSFGEVFLITLVSCLRRRSGGGWCRALGPGQI